MTGYSKTPLLKKLGIKTGFRVLLIHAPAHFLDLLGPLPEETVLVQKDAQNLDVIVFFTAHRAALELEFPRLAKQIKSNGMVWIAWPKKASKVPTDLSFNGVQNVGLHHGLVDVKVCAIDAVWSGLKFMYRRADRQ